MMKFKVLLAGCLLALSLMPAAAETNQIRASKQYGLSYLPLMIMEDQKLVEKHAAALGLNDIQVSWVTLGGSNAMNDALLSGGLDFGAGGVPNLVTLWAKTRNTPTAIHGVAALNDMPVDLVSSNPNVKKLSDFSEKDKIAVTSVKISTQALLLQMACAKQFGEANFAKYDSLTVSMPHPEAMTALMSGGIGINAHFSSPPFQYTELADPKIHKVLNNYEILGGPATFNVIWATSKFRNENPKAYQAFFEALKESIDIINKDKKKAAETYKRMAHTQETVEFLLGILNDPLVTNTIEPHKTLPIAQFLAKVKRIPVAPTKWQDIWFPEIHSLKGS
ncbi:MAG: ABC transporter substrate-binding protein [Afipia sp.]|nr:ABC transporter substrate-binding protein [Afipia sp.]